MIEIIECSTTWCQPCKAMQPIIHQLANEGHNIRSVDMDTPEGKTLAARFGGISAVPTFLVLDKNGVFIKKLVGAKTRAQLLQELT